jgi:ATP-dependent Clp protease ATP-binding subunit ClpA
MFPKSLRQKTTLIHNAIDTDVFRPDAAVRQAVRRELGLQEQTLVVGHVARMCEVKNQSFLLDLMSKVLAQQLHLPLHRFDMSEYSEKHSVAKLIGSPAGYVGYDDGGILTDTIRKNPHCVLLLDEIEKAHEDIYNLLLQVMDYAVISDNKGRKIDFRNVILIMTSNAGARYARQASMGFERKTNAGAAMAKEVRKVFTPEFLNRLSSVVVFNDMDRKMAGMILDDKISKLQERLKARKVKLVIEPEAYTKLLDEGFSPEYGAREIERTLNSRLTPLLMREILFGEHKGGFTATIKATQEGYTLES